MVHAPINVCEAETPEGLKHYVTCLSLDDVFARGLAPEAIVGELLRPLEPGERISPDVFARNRIFVEFMHDVIARRAPQLPGFIAEARRQGNGWMYVIDQRTPTPQGGVPPHDVVGAFEVRDGSVVTGSYQRNSNHTILSDDGFFQLGSELHSCLMDELMALNHQAAP